MSNTVQYLVATLLPAIASAVLYLLMSKTRLRDANYWLWQVIAGVVFGLVAIYGTEFGIHIHDAVINVRDAAPITAGLLFGGPAGIIAGFMGGIERWFSVLWGRGEFTRVACSVATSLAGIYAALLHHYLFEERRPSIALGAAIGVTIEVLHLILVFITNPDDPGRAFDVVQACAGPMISLNGVAVALAILVMKLLEHEPLVVRGDQRGISEQVLSGMLSVFVVVLLATWGFAHLMQTRLALNDTGTILSVNIDDVRDDIQNAANRDLLDLAYRVAGIISKCDEAGEYNLAELAEALEVVEIHVVNADGIIVASSDEKFIGYDMSSGEQSAAFLAIEPGGRGTELVQNFQPMSYDQNVWRKYAGVTIDDGFVQVAYDADQFQDDLARQVVGSAEHRHVGETGFILIVNESNEIVGSSSSSSSRKLAYTGIEDEVEAAEPGEVFEATYLTTPCYAMHKEAEGYTIIALQPVYEANHNRDVAVLIMVFMLVLVFAALFSVIYAVIKRVVVIGIRRVNGRLLQITGGNLDVEVDVRNSLEFNSLSDGINHTVTALKGYIAEAAARIDQELVYARQIQHAALPSRFPFRYEVDGFELYASMDPAKQVGGDFYDFYMLDEHHLVFLVADVSGKGIPASLFMMRAKAELKSYAERGASVEEVLAAANNRLCEGNDANMFVTAWMGILDVRTGVVVYANAGHNPPAIRDAEGKWSLLTMRKNLVLGFMDDVPYRSETLQLVPGGIIYVYTDGVVEALNERDEQYGDERLLTTLAAYDDGAMEDLCNGVRADMSVFVGEAEQFDDITMLALHYAGPEGAGSTAEE